MHTAITTITPTTTSRIIAATTPPAIAPVLSGSAMAPSVVAVEEVLLSIGSSMSVETEACKERLYHNSIYDNLL